MPALQFNILPTTSPEPLEVFNSTEIFGKPVNTVPGSSFTYSLPLLLTFLPPLYIHHFALLVCSVHMLLQPMQAYIVTNRCCWSDAQRFRCSPPWALQWQRLYSQLASFDPLRWTTRQWGPLWTFSAFGFEHKNGFLMGHTHSPHNIADQLLFS